MLKLKVAGKPAFLRDGHEYACAFCPVRLTTEADMVEHWNWEMEREGIPEEEIAYPEEEASRTKLLVKEGVPEEEIMNPDSGGVVYPNLDQFHPEDNAKSIDCDGGGDLQTIRQRLCQRT